MTSIQIFVIMVDTLMILYILPGLLSLLFSKKRKKNEL